MPHSRLQFWPIGEFCLTLGSSRPYTDLFRIGRKPIILLSTAGSILSLAWELAVISFQGILPVQLILTGPLFNVVGGGGTVLVANLYSMASDMVAATDRYVLPEQFSNGLYLTRIYPEPRHSSS